MNDIRHFAIQADDLDRARRFYTAVFGWKVEPWGPPDFFQITTSESEGAILGALQRRRELVEDKRTTGYECTVGVEDVDAVADAVIANGGRVVMNKTVIAGVGELLFFEDPEGNVAGAMRYDPTIE
jgi:predicted enzyme related to lactoylglutathione lyase